MTVKSTSLCCGVVFILEVLWQRIHSPGTTIRPCGCERTTVLVSQCVSTGSERRGGSWVTFARCVSVSSHNTNWQKTAQGEGGRCPNVRWRSTHLICHARAHFSLINILYAILARRVGLKFKSRRMLTKNMCEKPCCIFRPVNCTAHC